MVIDFAYMCQVSEFSIEVHDAKRVVQTLSSFNLYEDSNNISSQLNKNDKDLAEAISESTTQVSLSRRSYNPGNIHVYVWFGKTQALTKCIWQSAISQHQFYLDRKQAKMRPFQLRTNMYWVLKRKMCYILGIYQ